MINEIYLNKIIMKNVFQIVGVAIFVLLSIIIGKTLTLSSKQVPSESFKNIYLSDNIFQNLSKAIQNYILQ